MRLLSALMLSVALFSTSGCATRMAAPAQSVSFLAPADGAVVTSPFVVKFGVTGMQVAPAGAIVADSGHHHLLIDAADIPSGTVIPADAQHLHFGKGQTETTLNLKPGKYKLTMQFANGYHESYGPAMSQSINITVQ